MVALTPLRFIKHSDDHKCSESNLGPPVIQSSNQLRGSWFEPPIVTNKNVHGVHDFVSFGDQSLNTRKVITPHTRHLSLILVCISYWQMGNTFAQ